MYFFELLKVVSNKYIYDQTQKYPRTEFVYFQAAIDVISGPASRVQEAARASALLLVLDAARAATGPPTGRLYQAGGG